MTSQQPARFSTYSGAPSLQPSLAPTDTTTATTNPARNTLQVPSGRNSNNNSNNANNMYAQPGSTASSSTLASDPKAADIKSWSAGFERMQDARLDKQRYVMSGNKSDEVSKLALGAKLERALGRRMTGQDASFSSSRKNSANGGNKTPMRQGEKGLEVEVN